MSPAAPEAKKSGYARTESFSDLTNRFSSDEFTNIEPEPINGPPRAAPLCDSALRQDARAMLCRKAGHAVTSLRHRTTATSRRRRLAAQTVTPSRNDIGR